MHSVFRPLMILLASCAAALSPPADADAQTELVAEIGAWRVLYAERSGDFKVCGAARRYEAGAWAHFDLINDGRDMLVTFYADAAPALPADAAPLVSFAFETENGGAQLEMTAQVVSTPQFNGVSFDHRPTLMKAFRRADSVRISYRGFDGPELALDAVAEALDAVEACAIARF